PDPFKKTAWKFDFNYDFLSLRYQFLYIYQRFSAETEIEKRLSHKDIPDAVSNKFREYMYEISKPACLSIVPEKGRPIGSMQEAVEKYRGGDWRSDELLRSQFTLPDDFDNW